MPAASDRAVARRIRQGTRPGHRAATETARTTESGRFARSVSLLRLAGAATPFRLGHVFQRAFATGLGPEPKPISVAASPTKCPRAARTELPVRPIRPPSRARPPFGSE